MDEARKGAAGKRVAGSGRIADVFGYGRQPRQVSLAGAMEKHTPAAELDRDHRYVWRHVAHAADGIGNGVAGIERLGVLLTGQEQVGRAEQLGAIGIGKLGEVPVIEIDRDRPRAAAAQLVGNCNLLLPRDRRDMRKVACQRFDIVQRRAVFEPVSRIGAEDESPRTVFLVEAPVPQRLAGAAAIVEHQTPFKHLDHRFHF